MTPRVGPRLRALRAATGMSLADLSRATGVAASVLSRIETGKRQPTLSHLTTLSATYDVSLDDLVGAPPRGDPRIRPRPVEREGMTLVPLTTRPGGIQAYKVVFPPASRWGEPRPRSHEGHQWLCVLNSTLRFCVDGTWHELGPGESLEYDTRRPHWMGSLDEEPAEVLMLFSASGLRHSTVDVDR